MNNKPSIVAVVSRYVSLRRSGKEHVGLCPFHADKNPSLSVSDSKGVFYCHGCGAKGDAIDWVMRLERLNFRNACNALGIEPNKRMPLRLTAKRKRAAELACAWVNEQ